MSDDVKPKVQPEWVKEDGGEVLLYDRGVRDLAAKCYDGDKGVVLAWHPYRGCIGERRNMTVDEAKAWAVKALREAGYAFVGDPEPVAAPAKEGDDDGSIPDPSPAETIEGHATDRHTVKCRYVTARAIEAVEAELAGGRVPLGCVEWTPAPGFRLFEPGEMVVAGATLLAEISERPNDPARWARLAAMAMVNVELIESIIDPARELASRLSDMPLGSPEYRETRRNLLWAIVEAAGEIDPVWLAGPDEPPKT